MTMENSKIYKFFSENVDWDKSERDVLKEKAMGWKVFSIFGWALAIVAFICAMTLIKVHEFVVVNVLTDRLTGNFETHVGKMKIDINDKKNENQINADLIRYVKAHVGFSRAEADSNYKTVYFMSSENLRPQWDAEYKPDLNKNALSNTMKASDKIVLTNFSITYIPVESNPDQKVAQVRYEKEKYISGMQPTTQAFVYVITFKYDPDYIPTDSVENLSYNPFGFVAINERIDEQSKIRFLKPASQAGGMQ